MRIIKVILETDEGTTLHVVGPGIQNVELEWLADIVSEAKLGIVHKRATGFGQYRIRLELVCAGYREPSKPPTKLIE